jgi:hypothetical protein
MTRATSQIAAAALIGLAAPAAAQDAALRVQPTRLQLELSFDTGGLDGDGRAAPAAKAGALRPSYGVALLFLRSLAGSASWVGSGIGYARALSPVPGRGPTELLLTPHLVTLPLAVKLALLPRVFATLEPALAAGWVSGTLQRTAGVPLDFRSVPGLGAQLSAGLELNGSDRFGLALRAGYRSVRPSLVVRRDPGPAGDSQPQPGAEHVDANLSGVFWTAGLVVRL